MSCVVDKKLGQMLKNNVISIIKDTLVRLIGNRIGFYVSFKTNAAGVILSQDIKQKYPEMITIVLEHQFRNLEIKKNKLEVELAFSGIYEKIIFPFSAVTKIHTKDPGIDMNFQIDNTLEVYNLHNFKNRRNEENEDLEEGEIDISDEVSKIIRDVFLKKDKAQVIEIKLSRTEEKENKKAEKKGQILMFNKKVLDTEKE